jgi:hypothetical protein
MFPLSLNSHQPFWNFSMEISLKCGNYIDIDQLAARFSFIVALNFTEKGTCYQHEKSTTILITSTMLCYASEVLPVQTWTVCIIS